MIPPAMNIFFSQGDTPLHVHSPADSTGSAFGGGGSGGGSADVMGGLDAPARIFLLAARVAASEEEWLEPLLPPAAASHKADFLASTVAGMFKCVCMCVPACGSHTFFTT